MPFKVDRPQDKIQHNTCFGRRRFLQSGLRFGVGATAALYLPNVFAGQSSPAIIQSAIAREECKLSLLNLHTGESLKATYWAEGQYQLDELIAINRILRDHRTGDIYSMDKALLDLLTVLHHEVNGKQQPFQVISGYRSPKTNALLNKKSNGVAKKSLHMQGKAIDIRLPGCRLSDLRKVAIGCQTGGVGYYPKSDFIHIDTGRVRRWG